MCISNRQDALPPPDDQSICNCATWHKPAARPHLVSDEPPLVHHQAALQALLLRPLLLLLLRSGARRAALRRRRRVLCLQVVFSCAQVSVQIDRCVRIAAFAAARSWAADRCTRTCAA